MDIYAILMHAAYNGDLDTLSTLYRTGRLQSSEDFGIAIHMAARKGHVEAVEMLLDYGADHTKLCSSGKTPLMLAAEHGHLSVVELLRNVDYKHKRIGTNTRFLYSDEARNT